MNIITHTPNIWFTADLHFGHESIIRHCNRPFKTIEEHDTALITNWNSCIHKKDTTYVLGDFAMPKKNPNVPSIKTYRRYFHALNGKKILIKGNHDKMSQDFYDLFTAVYDIREIKMKHKKVVLMHFPLQSWNGMCHGWWHLFGHTHGRLPVHDWELKMDIGVDTNNYFPYLENDIFNKLLAKEKIWEQKWNVSINSTARKE